jgi:cell division protein FtsL
MPHHRAGDPPLKVTREIPLPWLITSLLALIVQAVAMWFGQQALVQSNRDLVGEVRELRSTVNSGALKAERLEQQLGDVQRRLAILEAADRSRRSP